MNLENLEHAEKLIVSLRELHTKFALIEGSADVNLTEDEQRLIYQRRITTLETELRATGIVAAVQKPALIRKAS